MVSDPLKSLKTFLIGNSLQIRKKYFPLSFLLGIKKIIKIQKNRLKRFKIKLSEHLNGFVETTKRKLTLLKFRLSGNLILEIKYGGLGDHLFYSHIPRIAKQTKKYRKVYISNYSIYKNDEIKDLVWNYNPYIDGFRNKCGLTARVRKMEKGFNFLDKIMLFYGLDDGKRFHEPEVYYRPKLREELRDKIVFDPNYISNAGDNKINGEVFNYFKRNNIHVNYQMKLKEKNIPIDDFDEWLESKSLKEFCDIVYSCKKIYCLVTGTATLTPALGKTANVLFNNGIVNRFLHSKKNKYINLSKK